MPGCEYGIQWPFYFVLIKIDGYGQKTITDL